MFVNSKVQESRKSRLQTTAEIVFERETVIIIIVNRTLNGWVRV